MRNGTNLVHAALLVFLFVCVPFGGSLPGNIRLPHPVILVFVSCGRADVSCPQCGYNLRRNISGMCPECGSKLALQVVAVGPVRRSITGALAFVRMALILIVFVPVSFAFAYFLSVVISGDNAFIPVSSGMAGPFGIVALLGAVTFVSLFAVRRIHFISSVLFFGFFTSTATFFFIDEIVYTTYTSVASAVASYASMFGVLSVGIAGLIIEIICDRKLWARSLIAFAASETQSSSGD